MAVKGHLHIFMGIDFEQIAAFAVDQEASDHEVRVKFQIRQFFGITIGDKLLQRLMESQVLEIHPVIEDERVVHVETKRSDRGHIQRTVDEDFLMFLELMHERKNPWNLGE